MLRTFNVINKKLKQVDIPETDDNSSIRQHLKDSMWVDLQDPTDDERLLIESFHSTDIIPESEDVEEIESSARYFVSDDNIHIHSLFLHHTEGKLKTATVAFILNEQQLLTFRDVELADFRLIRMRARHGFVNAETPTNIMVSILEQKVDDLADAIEDIYKDLEDVSSKVLEETNDLLEDAIDIITRQEDENGKIRMCLMDTQRSITYLQRHIRHHEADFETCREMLRDIETLTGHTAFIFDKINFLMDAAQGFINIEQNQVIKTLSIATVFFMPPTLIASLYGMNFQFMPELSLKYGYLLALSIMVVSALIPYIYFKRKKWL